ncbi:MAG: alpha/beta hydrolase [Comamonadaceae bacterium]|nr:MAG: alpha/beta hydrolase [Comamonadaceae bacterium]
MHNIARKFFLPVVLLLSLALAACGGGGGGGGGGSFAGLGAALPASAPEPAPQATSQVIPSSVRGTQNGNVYAVQVFLPASYAGGTSMLPVIYATEGDALYGAGGTQTRFDAFKNEMLARGTQAILVGIGGTARRNTDFLLPGASQYLNFITADLAPSIERQYRADPKRRALSGLSHGGYFVVAALVLEGSAGSLSFSHYLSTESSVGGEGNLAAFLEFEKQLKASGKAVPATLFLAGAANGNGAVIVEPLYAQMLAQAIPQLTLVRASYGTTHVGADLPAFQEALTRFVP